MQSLVARCPDNGYFKLCLFVGIRVACIIRQHPDRPWTDLDTDDFDITQISIRELLRSDCVDPATFQDYCVYVSSKQAYGKPLSGRSDPTVDILNIKLPPVI